MTFRINQRVVCIKVGDWNTNDDEFAPSYGEVYTIRGIRFCSDGICALLFCEIVNRPHMYDAGLYECDFADFRFRPVVEDRKRESFTMGADPESERWDNRKKISEEV